MYTLHKILSRPKYRILREKSTVEVQTHLTEAHYLDKSRTVYDGNLLRKLSATLVKHYLFAEKYS